MFNVKDASTSIGTVKSSIRDSQHDTLCNILSPLATDLVISQLQKSIGARSASMSWSSEPLPSTRR